MTMTNTTVTPSMITTVVTFQTKWESSKEVAAEYRTKHQQSTNTTTKTSSSMIPKQNTTDQKTIATESLNMLETR